MSIAAQIPKKMHGKVLRSLLNTFSDNELDGLISIIHEEKQRRINEKN